MTEQFDVNRRPQDRTYEPRRKSHLVAIGAILWVMCFAGFAMLLIQGRNNLQGEKSDVQSLQSDADNGRNSKQIQLVPRKDGGFDAQTGSVGVDNDPWEAEGIDDFSFTDCSGQPVTKQSLLGKPFVIGFIFTNCRGPCPTVTLQMRELQKRLKEYDFHLVTLTVDPERDTAQTLLEYGKGHEADFDRWKFLTGDQTEIYRLIQQSFKMPVKETKGSDRTPGFEIIHSRNLMLVDPTGRVVGKFDALAEEDMARLRKDLKRLAKRKADKQAVGSEDNQK